MKIFDVIKVRVSSSVIMPEIIRMNVGGTVSLLQNDKERRDYLTQNAEWKSDDSTIVSIHPTDGTAKALREGKTKIHLVSKNQMKEKISTTISVNRVRSASVNLSEIPKYITDIKSNSNYRNEYRYFY